MDRQERRLIPDRRRRGTARRLAERRQAGDRRAILDRRQRPAEWEGAREHIRNAIQLFGDLESTVPIEERVDFQSAVQRLWFALQALERRSP